MNATSKYDPQNPQHEDVTVPDTTNSEISKPKVSQLEGLSS